MGGILQPIFFALLALTLPSSPAYTPPAASAAGLSTTTTAIESTVAGLHYELVEIEHAARGLLRITIDRIAGQVYPTGESISVTVDDCEAVTRQLRYVLEVEGIDYERLEVSSPGLDRPLKTEGDFARHVGAEITLVLKMPLAGRKNFRGRLQGDSSGWSLVFHDGKAEQQLNFKLEELREIRLVPVLDFKGHESGRKLRRERRRAAAAPAAADDGGKVR